MSNTSPLEQVPCRIKYYLLDWKDTYMKEYIEKYGDVSLHNLTKLQLQELFNYITTTDLNTFL